MARNKNVSVERPKDETEAIADIFKRMDEIQERLEHERRQRKKLAERIYYGKSGFCSLTTKK